MSQKTLLVFLHGSGGTGRDMRSFFNMVPLKDFGHQSFGDICQSQSIDILTPTAPSRKYTAASGERMNIWFDRTAKFFTADGLDDEEDIYGIDNSVKSVFEQIHDIEANYDHIFFGGHSMGGVVALNILRSNVSAKYRGVFSISSSLPNMSSVFVGAAPLGTAAKLPVLMMHGERDDMVPCAWARKTASTLLLKGVDVQFRSYPKAGHGMEDYQLAELLHWMQDVRLSSESDDSDSRRGGHSGGDDDDAKQQSSSEAKSSSSQAKQTQTQHQHQQQQQAQYKRGADDKMHKDDNDGDKEEEEEEEEDSSSVEAVDRLMRAMHTQTVATTSAAVGKNSSSSSSGASANSARPAATASSSSSSADNTTIPFTVEYLVEPHQQSSSSSFASPKVVIRYPVPPELVAVMCARPVLACGSMFEILPDPANGGIKTTLTSSDPSRTAFEIGRRLQNRVTSGSGSLNPCAMS